jgi:hypothetical protein
VTLWIHEVRDESCFTPSFIDRQIDRFDIYVYIDNIRDWCRRRDLLHPILVPCIARTHTKFVTRVASPHPCPLHRALTRVILRLPCLLAQQVLELVNVRAAATGALNTPRYVCVCVWEHRTRNGTTHPSRGIPMVMCIIFFYVNNLNNNKLNFIIIQIIYIGARRIRDGATHPSPASRIMM